MFVTSAVSMLVSFAILAMLKLTPQENNPADRHVQQVSEIAAAQQEDLPDFLREPARTR